MWRDMEEEAITIGLDLHYFWTLTPKQFEKHVKVFAKNEKQRLQEQDLLNFILGKYVSYAFNDPKKYPHKNFLAFEEKEEMTDEEMEKMARRNTLKMGGVIT